MQVRTVVAVVLAVFVAASVAVLVKKELRRGASEGLPEAAGGSSSPGQATASPAAAEQPGPGQVFVYYFHRSQRCPTCMNMERYAHEAVATGFAPDLEEGRIRWLVLNYEAPENEPLKKRYELASPAVVLVRADVDGRPSFENLAEVWPLAFDKPAFLTYVQEQLRAFLAATPADANRAG